MIHRFALSTIAALVLAACGSSSKPQPESASATGDKADGADDIIPGATAEVAPDIGEGVAWAGKSSGQKGAFMEVRVVPAVRAIWGGSPEPDHEVNCKLCHGKSADRGLFDMPTADLLPLNPANSFEVHRGQAAWLEFMGKKLTPVMVETLGVEPYDVQTHKGFGCFACHTMAGGNAQP